MHTLLNEEAVVVLSAGARLRGMLHLPLAPTSPVPAVLMLHGFTGCADGDNRILVRQARALANAGIAALRCDFRGSGESEGQFHEMTLSGEVADARVLLDWLTARPEIDASRIGLLGFSMGGAITGCLLGERPHIGAVVLWAPVAHPFALLSRSASSEQRQAANNGIIDVGGEGVGPAFLQELPEIDPLAGVTGMTVPLRAVHGTADQTVPFSESEAFVAAVAGPSEIVAIEGANHTFTAIPWREQLRSATTDWFRAYL